MLKDGDKLTITGKFNDGDAFLQSLEQQTPERLPDVVLLDLKMTPKNGIETAADLNIFYPEIKIIILSTYYNKSFVGYIFKLGVNAFLSKSIDKEELLRAIQAVHQSNLYLTPEDNLCILEYLKAPISPGSLFNPKEDLTDREIEVLQLICDQKTNKEIADQLYLSKRTVDGHRMNLIEKTGARNTAGLVMYAIHNKIISLEEFNLKQTIGL